MNLYSNNMKDIRFVYMFWAGLFVVLLIRSFYFGINYFPFLDDYNTYGIFNRRNAQIWNDIILYYRHYTWRPFAFFADAYITQWFWPNMWPVLLFHVILHFAAVWLFHRVMVLSGLNFGLLGIIIISLTPILAEAVYWIGASTRLVTGMFFSVLSVYVLLVHIKLQNQDKYYKRLLLLFALLNFIATGFYEQIIAFNLVFTGAVIFLNRHKIYAYTKIITAIPIINTVAMIVYYIIMAPLGRVGERAVLIAFGDVFSHFFNVTRALGNLLLITQYEISFNGLVRSFSLINLWGAFVLLLLVLFSIFVVFSYSRTYLIFGEERYSKYHIRLALGFILTMAAFSPFYLLADIWLPPRIIYPAAFGIAVFIDALFSFVFKDKLTFLKSLIPGVLIIPFFLIFIAEVNNYRLLEEIDRQIMYNFLETFEQSGQSDQNMVVLFNTAYVFAGVTGGGSPHRLENITSSNWAMLGKANATSREFYFRQMEPVQNTGNFPGAWAEGALFGLNEDFSVNHLNLRGNNLYVVNTGQLFGRVEIAPEDSAFLRFIKE